jgi:hypothetical protein
MPNQINKTNKNNLVINKNLKTFSLNEKFNSQQIFTETKNFIKHSSKEKLLEFNDEEKKDTNKKKNEKKSDHSSITCK